MSEPRGCPTPGACSAVGRIAKLEDTLVAVERDLSYVTGQRDAKDAGWARCSQVCAELETKLARVTEAANGYITALDEYRRSDWQRDVFHAEKVCLALTATEKSLRATLSDAARKP